MNHELSIIHGPHLHSDIEYSDIEWPRDRMAAMNQTNSNENPLAAKCLPSLDLLRAVTDAASDALFVKDAVGRYLYVNATAVRLALRDFD